MDILEFLFPKKCVSCRKFGDYICTDCFTRLDFDVPPICGVCGKGAIGGLTHPICKTKHTIDGVFTSVVYKGVSKKLVYQFKFQPNLSVLQSVLGDIFYEGIIQHEGFYNAITKDSYLAPIPLHSSRMRERGYNQAMLLAKTLAARTGLPVKTLLQRVNKTPSQVGKTEMERRENMSGAFKVVKSLANPPETVFLIDDVITSGATCNEAAGVLKKAGVKKVWGLAFAHGV